LGNVRSERVKRIARELMRLYPERFTADFETNKQIVKALTKTSSPKLINWIAGYITHLASVTAVKASESAKTEENESEDLP